MNKDGYQSTSARRALALLYSPRMCGRRKLDKLLDTFQSFNLNIGVTQSKRYVTFYCILFFKNHLSF